MSAGGRRSRQVEVIYPALRSAAPLLCGLRLQPGDQPILLVGLPPPCNPTSQVLIGSPDKADGPAGHCRDEYDQVGLTIDDCLDDEGQRVNAEVRYALICLSEFFEVALRPQLLEPDALVDPGDLRPEGNLALRPA